MRRLGRRRAGRDTTQYGLYFPNFGKFGDPGVVVEIAATAERAGWDGLFPFDHLQVGHEVGPVVDTWVTLAAVAAVTERIRIGPMVTPVPRRRPAKLAREAVTLDHLSGGRLILGVGIGGPPDLDFGNFGDAADDRVRGRQLDEGLELLDALWSGEVVHHRGMHYTALDARFLPRPVQRPRIPIWVGGMWPRKPAFRRAARWDGVFPIATGDTLDDYVAMTPEILTEILGYVTAHRETDGPFDVAVIGSSFPGNEGCPPDDLAGAGATWWMEYIDWPDIPIDEWLEFIAAGPPSGKTRSTGTGDQDQEA